MKLFEIDPDTGTVQLNKPWIQLIPLFKKLITRDKGSKGDVDGRKKFRAIKEFTFIYFYTDFASPITDWDDDTRWKEALHYAELTDKDIDEDVLAANTHYSMMQNEGSTSLRTYKSLLKARSAMDDYLENLDFTKLDKKGELVNSPDRVAGTIAKLDSMHTAISNFRKRVEQELKDVSTGIRGTAELGMKEERNSSKFEEADIIKGSNHAMNGGVTSAATFDAMGDMLKELKDETPVVGLSGLSLTPHKDN